MSVKDYNIEPELNVSISGISIAEGCAPSGINDALRQLMADVKEESEAQARAASEASTQLSSLDSTLRAFIAEEVAGAKTEASSSASSLEAALRSLISQEVAKCYPKSGGVLGGTIIRNGFLAQNSVDDNLLIIRGGTDATSAYMGLCGKTHSNKGMAYFQAADGTDSATFSFLPSGAAVFGGNAVVTLADSWRSGANWYRKYSNGFIMQGGYVSHSISINAGLEASASIPLNTPFASTSYSVLYNAAGAGVLTSGSRSRQTNKFTAYALGYAGATRTWSGTFWFACGY